MMCPTQVVGVRVEFKPRPDFGDHELSNNTMLSREKPYILLRVDLKKFK